VHAVSTPLGLQPEYADIEWRGLDFTPERFAQVMKIDRGEWMRELVEHDGLFAGLGAKQPLALASQRRELETRLQA